MPRLACFAAAFGVKRRVLEQPPAHSVLIENEVEFGAGGFVRLLRRDCRLRYASGELSELFTYDAVERRAFDAAVIVAYFISEAEPHVVLRSCVRPPIGFRARQLPNALASELSNLWELPAGLIDESGELDVAARACAARELLEETGYLAPPAAFAFLGGPTLPLPGVIAERQYFLSVEIDPAARGIAGDDGSPLEAHGRVIAVPLGRALDECRAGRICDGKTELGLRRFMESWHAPK